MTLRLKAGNKFGAKRTTVDGMTFASRQEANRYAELKMLQKAGEIRGLVTQMSWHLTVNGCEIGRYVADFDYDERQGDRWVHVTEDAKGFRTPVYKLKKALMLACHGITIRETRAR